MRRNKSTIVRKLCGIWEELVGFEPTTKPRKRESRKRQLELEAKWYPAEIYKDGRVWKEIGPK